MKLQGFDMDLLETLLANGVSMFFCDDESQRLPFLEALDSLGYYWQSGHRLTELNSDRYRIQPGDATGIVYMISGSGVFVTYGRTSHQEDAYEVSRLFKASASIDQQDFLQMLEA